MFDLAKEQVVQGHEVTVLCANEPTTEATAIVSGISVIRLPYRCKVMNTNITSGLFRELLRRDYDVIHTHMPTPWSADLSGLASLLKNKPLVMTYHNDILKASGGGRILADVYNATLLRLLCKQAAGIIITQEGYLAYSRHLGQYARKIATIPVGVRVPLDIENSGRHHGQLFFLSVLDEYHEYKGLSVLLEAMGAAKRHCHDITLLIGGSGGLTNRYKAIAQRLGIAEAVRFLGFLTDEDLAKTYASSEVFILPSIGHSEGFGIVALEALSYGTPVITTSLTGSSEFIRDRRAGLVVEANDVDGLTRAITALLDNSVMAREMGVRGAEAVQEEFGWEGIASQVNELYMSALRCTF